MSEHWEALRKLIRAGDTPGTVRSVAGYGDAERRAVAAELPSYLAARAEAADGRWWEWRREFRPLLMAGVGCLGGAAAVASWIYRREFRWRGPKDGESRMIVDLVRRRPAAWQRDLARRVTLRLRVTHENEWFIAAGLLKETGVEPPDNEAFLMGWVRRLGSGRPEDDPLLSHLAPRIFEMSGLRQAFAAPQADAVLRLVQSGHLDRAEVLGQVVRRLLRDGADGPPVLAELHDRLGPEPDEVTGRVGDYAAMLPVAPVAVSVMALTRLRWADEAGRLDEELFAEAVEALAFRPERKLVQAAVAWAQDAAERVPARSDVALRVIAEVFRQDSLVSQERAVRAAVRLAGRAGEEARRVVLEAAGALPAGPREKIATAYGETVEAETVEAPALVAPPAPALPPPVSSPAELAEAVAAVEHGVGAGAFERILAGLAQWAHREPDALREALRPWWQPLQPQAFGHYAHYDSDERLHLLLMRAVLAFASPKDSRRLTKRIRRNAHDPEETGGLDRLYETRARELIAAYETASAPPLLLATPTSGTGHLAPEALLDRLERLAAAGAEPLPGDLAHALLRLPRTVDEAAAERAGKIGTKAGDECAAWLRGGGLPDPEVRCSVQRGAYGWGVRADELRVELELPERLPGLARPGSNWTDSARWWPMAAPSHRELVAAHLLSARHSSDDGHLAVAALAHGDGPAGTAVAYLLATGMSEEDPPKRAAAVDGLLVLAARGEVPVPELVEALVTLLPAGLVTLSRVVSALGEAAHAGGHEAVWAVVAGLLPRLLPEAGERPRAGLADLLAVGATAATFAGVHGEVPRLAETAARKGSSRLTREARRLHGLLTARSG
ncbi:DUF6493 family protein [Nonomuraea sp. CA-218870]|uniref:DUF7824 domain-containing protein n=1 Tax=Nonomuraea sp. CA-218870 TaxID=3239998 RepID=UPI003D8B8E38